MKGRGKRIYLDYASSTPVCEEAREAMNCVLDMYGNPGALHMEGLGAAQVLDEARTSIAKHMGVKAPEIIFVSGGTEGNNLAILGFFNSLVKEGVDISTLHMITSAIEHSSVLETCKELERREVAVTYVKPDERGVVRPEKVKEALRKNTVLVSIGLVNGEIGTIQPIHAISKIVKEHEVKFGNRVSKNSETRFPKTAVMHTDACQGMYVSLVPQGLGVDLLTLDSTKMYGPRGVGILYVRKGTKLTPILFGGGQEQGLRSGTENTVLYAGFAEAFNRVARVREDEKKRLERLQEDFLREVSARIPDIVINGTGKHQSQHIANISVPNIDAEYTVLYLDARGVAISTKSACKEKEGSNESHVVKELGGEKWRAENTLRFSFGSETTKENVSKALMLLEESASKQNSFKKKD